MDFEVGSLVKSKCGRDGNRYYIVVKVLNGAPYIADGKKRKIEMPKRKNKKHLDVTKKKYNIEISTTNKQLKKYLFQYNYEGVCPSQDEGEVFSCQNKML